jgi:hypothetical protein
MPKKKPLTPKQLSDKYDTGKPVNFEKVLKKLTKAKNRVN